MPKNLRALITAGASGIGYAIAQKFAEAGLEIIICDVDNEALERCAAAHDKWHIYHCDVANEESVDTLFAQLKDNFGGLDILVNNAGIAGPTGGIETLEPTAWRETIAVNLTGQFYCCRLAVPLLGASKHASIINISSVAGRLGYGGRTPYAASKWGVIGLTKSLAIELGPRGIRVNALLPGIVDSPRMNKVISQRAEMLDMTDDQMRTQFLERVSLRRMVSMEDIANQALFLVSPWGANISGQAISICANVENL